MSLEITLHSPVLHGSIPAIPSKSHVHRLLICAALSDAPTRIRCSHAGADIEATVRCLNALGARIAKEVGGFEVLPIPKAPEDRPSEAVLDCGESGSTLRFLLPLAAALGVKSVFRLSGRLPERPISPLVECLEQHGARISADPALTLNGRIGGGEYVINGSLSSQFTTGLLLALGLTGHSARIHLTGKVESRPYLDLTVAALRAFGVSAAERDSGFILTPSEPHSPGVAEAEGDWSNAAFWLAAGALSRNPEGITVTGLRADSPQGDRAIVPLLRSFGASCVCSGTAVTVSPGKLRSIEADAADIPDLVPVLAAAASVSEGETVLRNCGRLRLKESDRMSAVRDTLNVLGGEVNLDGDCIIIKGRKNLIGGRVSAGGDHRIAMAAAVASLVCSDSVTIDGCECVSKSYPCFFDDFAALGGKETR